MRADGERFLRAGYRSRPPSLLRGFCRIRSAGHYAVGAGFRDRVMRKDFLELFWTVRGCGCFRYGDEEFRLPEGSIFCYLPGDRHEVFAGAGPWEYCWLTLDGPEAGGIAERFGFGRAVKFAGPCPAEIFDEVISCLGRVDPAGARTAEIRCYELLCRAANPIGEAAVTPGRRFMELAAENFRRPDFSIEEAASRLGMHRSSLHRILREECGTGPHEYLTEFRLRRAADMLTDGCPVSEVARRCGFRTANYFAKVFRSRFGCPPSAFCRGAVSGTA